MQTREYAGAALSGSTLTGALEYTYQDKTNQISAVTAKSALGVTTLGNKDRGRFLVLAQ